MSTRDELISQAKEAEKSNDWLKAATAYEKLGDQDFSTGGIVIPGPSEKMHEESGDFYLDAARAYRKAEEKEKSMRCLEKAAREFKKAGMPKTAERCLERIDNFDSEE